MRISSKPLMKTFKLKSDPDGVAEITVNQARQGEHTERQDQFSKITRVYDDPLIGKIGLEGKVRLEVEQNNQRLRRKEAYLTLGSVSGILVEDKEGMEVELFKSTSGPDGTWVRYAMSEEAFNRAYDRLPPEMAEEIAECVYEVNGTWDPDRQGE